MEEGKPDLGITEAVISGHKVKITNLARSVCDAVKYRNKVGMNICSEVIRNYIHRKDRNLSRLSDYAKRLRVGTSIKNYMDVLIYRGINIALKGNAKKIIP